MKKFASLIAMVLALTACGGDDMIADNAVPPDLNSTSETPGDWSALAGMVGRTPAQSGLFEESPILIDLNAMLGPSVDVFRNVMANATPLTREGPLLVTRARNGEAYLIIDPTQHALEAGIRQRMLWRTHRTAGAEIARPPSVQALMRDGNPET